MKRKPKVLIVDDEAHIRLLYRTELESAGYEVAELPNGTTLLETLARDCPDLMVLDIRMPGPSGLELLSAVRAAHGRLAVILSSAYSSYQGDMSTLPADAYVLKSSDVTPLLDTVKSLLDERLSDVPVDDVDAEAPTAEPKRSPTRKTKSAPKAKPKR
ncbi:MAG: response regulator [Deltaproteobacteria bacterium]|nr:response regulator [Deltaproteobacteria bacterium]